MYAVVVSLKEWAGVIKLQPVTIWNDHQALRDWVTEHVDTPSGHRGRRVRWNEVLPKYNLTIKYVPELTTRLQTQFCD